MDIEALESGKGQVGQGKRKMGWLPEAVEGSKSDGPKKLVIPRVLHDQQLTRADRRLVQFQSFLRLQLMILSCSAMRKARHNRAQTSPAYSSRARSLSEYSQIAESRGMGFSSVFASIPAMESSTPDGGFHGIEFSSESMIANTRTGS